MTYLYSAFFLACVGGFFTSTTATQRNLLYPVYDEYSDSQLQSENRGDISLTLNTTELSQPDAEWVRLTWSGVRFPRKDDMVVLYAIEEPSWQKKDPIKMTPAAVDPAYLSRGAGSLKY